MISAVIIADAPVDVTSPVSSRAVVIATLELLLDRRT
jgi:hypothetical protein